MILSLARAKYVLYPAKCIFRGDVNLKGTYPIVLVTRSYHQPIPFLMWIQCGFRYENTVKNATQINLKNIRCGTGKIWDQNLIPNFASTTIACTYRLAKKLCMQDGMRLAIIYGDGHRENVLHDKNFCKDALSPSPVRSKQWFPSFHSQLKFDPPRKNCRHLFCSFVFTLFWVHEVDQPMPTVQWMVPNSMQ